LWAGLSAIIAVAFLWEATQLFRIIDSQGAIGTDLAYYRFVADRWLSTGVYYTPEQLQGPYVVRTQVHNLYPPHALYLFVPFLFLPAILWWVIPLALIAYVIAWCRPAAWAWPVIALIVAFPKTPAQMLFGNTDMWITAFIAAGVRWGWPAILVSIKPSLGFFALLGIRSRGWWMAATAIALLSLPLLGVWLEYPTIARNSSAQPLYSFGNLPFFVLPLVAWLTSTRRGQRSLRDWAASLLRGGRTALEP